MTELSLRRSISSNCLMAMRVFVNRAILCENLVGLAVIPLATVFPLCCWFWQILLPLYDI